MSTDTLRIGSMKIPLVDGATIVSVFLGVKTSHCISDQEGSMYNCKNTVDTLPDSTDDSCLPVGVITVVSPV